MEIYLPAIKLTVENLSGIELVLNVSKEFTTYCHPCSPVSFNAIYKTVPRIAAGSTKPDFFGHSFNNSIIPYEYKIFSNSSGLLIHILFLKHNEISELQAEINFNRKLITVNIVPAGNRHHLTIDPLFHPLGSLLMIYLASYSGGLLIHASGVNNSGNGYLFTGISGIGKSTMAMLWHNSSATVINDDRLWIQPVNGVYTMFSIPMINYSQKPLMAPLSKIFLLSQTPENIITQTSGSKSTVQLMANCIHHLFNKTMTTSHINTVFNITSKIPVYQLGFKPNSEVVQLIKNII